MMQFASAYAELDDAGDVRLSEPSCKVDALEELVEEFDGEQLHDLLVDAGFDAIEMRGVHHGPRIGQWEAVNGSIVAAQVTAALTGTWSPGLREMIRSITVDDFTVDVDAIPATQDRIAAAQDLVAIAWVTA